MMVSVWKRLEKNKFLQVLVAGLFATLPFERIPTVDLGFYTVKASYIFGLILLIAVIPWVAGLFRENRLTGIDFALLAFWLIGLFSLLGAPDLKHSLVVLFMWAFVFVLYFILSRLLTNPVWQERVERIVILVSVIVCVFGIYQFLGDSLGLSTAWTGLRYQYTKAVFGFPRIQSVGLEPLYFGDFLLVPFFLVLVRYIRADGLINKYWYVSGLLSINIILGIARGVYVALGLTLAIFLVYLFRLNKDRINYRQKVTGVLVSILVASGISYALVQLPNGSKATGNFVEHAAVVSDVKGGGESVVGRVATFKNALRLFKAKPILGQGVGSYGVLSTTEKARTGGGGYGVVNNEYLEVLAETGVLGFLAFLSFLLATVLFWYRAFKKSNKDDKIALLALFLGVAAIFVQYNFFSTLYIIHLWVFLALLRAKGTTALADGGDK